MPRIGHIYRWNNTTQKDCDAMGGNVNQLPSHDYEQQLDPNPAAEKPQWWYVWRADADGRPDWKDISMINGTPLLDDEGSPIKSGTCPSPSCSARKGARSDKSILDIIIRRETRRIRRKQEKREKQFTVCLQFTYNAVPEDIIWHINRRDKTLVVWALRVLKSRRQSPRRSPRKAGTA